MVDYSETTGATRLKSWHRINPNVDCVQGNYVSRSLLDPLPSANIPNTWSYSLSYCFVFNIAEQGKFKATSHRNKLKSFKGNTKSLLIF